MAGITTYLSILTLNVNGLNSHIKRHHLAKWIKREDMKICCLQETHHVDRNKHWLRIKSWKRFTKLMAPQNRQE
jgi:exonuclease III